MTELIKMLDAKWGFLCTAIVTLITLGWNGRKQVARIEKIEAGVISLEETQINHAKHIRALQDNKLRVEGKLSNIEDGINEIKEVLKNSDSKKDDLLMQVISKIPSNVDTTDFEQKI